MSYKKSISIIASFFAFILGILYVISGSLCISNWLIGFAGLEHLTLFPKLIPSDPWLGVVLISIGLAFTSSMYYLVRNNIVLNIASLLVGGGIAVIVMAIQLLTVLANLFDELLIGNNVNLSNIIAGVLRVDALLGYLALVPFILSYKLYKGLRSIPTQR